MRLKSLGHFLFAAAMAIDPGPALRINPFTGNPAAAPHYGRHRRRYKRGQGYLTIQANGGRLTKRGKRGYGLTPHEVLDPDVYLNSHARREKHLALFD